ncbi:MAG: SpoVG family protein [Endomicrobium sp.]|jgi:DNA-binding cell septation regulator SpoVG|nr:SpoVG family protein [Endomicrobium sp.]
MNKIFKLVYIISLFLCYLSSTFFADELKITKISTEKDNYSIVLNNAITINNIALKKNRNNTKIIIFPSYAGKGKIYTQFSVLNREYLFYLAHSISENKIYDFAGETLFEINKFSQTKKKGGIKAFASVIFENLLEVECRVMEGKNGLWIAWPANKTSTGWKADFIFVDKDLKNRVEKSLIQRYDKKENERK